jgi:predicted nucleic-acid-binding protein
VIGLDTNVLVRYLTQDDPAQAAKATRVIESAEAGGLFLSAVVVCELVWVLEESYDQTREQIAQVLERLLLSGQLVFENKDLLWQVLRDYRQGKGDVADYVIGRVANRAGASETVTFDRGLKSSELFRLL